MLCVNASYMQSECAEYGPELSCLGGAALDAEHGVVRTEGCVARDASCDPAAPLRIVPLERLSPPAVPCYSTMKVVEL